MDDTRIEWIKVKLEEGLQSIHDPSVFEEFITRDEGKNETLLQEFLNNISRKANTLLFYTEEKEEEEEVEVEIGTCKQYSILCFILLREYFAIDY